MQGRLPNADHVEAPRAAGPRRDEAGVRELAELPRVGVHEAVAGGEEDERLPGDPQGTVQVVHVQVVQAEVQALQHAAAAGLDELVRVDGAPADGFSNGGLAGGVRFPGGAIGAGNARLPGPQQFYTTLHHAASYYVSSYRSVYIYIYIICICIYIYIYIYTHICIY